MCHVIIIMFLCCIVYTYNVFFVVKSLLESYMLTPSSHHLYGYEAKLVNVLVPEASSFFEFTQIVKRRQRTLMM